MWACIPWQADRWFLSCEYEPYVLAFLWLLWQAGWRSLPCQYMFYSMHNDGLCQHAPYDNQIDGLRHVNHYSTDIFWLLWQADWWLVQRRYTCQRQNVSWWACTSAATPSPPSAPPVTSFTSTQPSTTPQAVVPATVSTNPSPAAFKVQIFDRSLDFWTACKAWQPKTLRRACYYFTCKLLRFHLQYSASHKHVLLACYNYTVHRDDLCQGIVPQDDHVLSVEAMRRSLWRS